MADTSGDIGRIIDRDYRIPVLDPTAADSRIDISIPERPKSKGDQCPGDTWCDHGQDIAHHPAERELLVEWAAGQGVQSGDPYVRLNHAVAFIVRRGLAKEFAQWLRSQS